MKSTNEEAFISKAGIAVLVSTKKDMSAIEFHIGEDIQEWLTNPLKIADGRTIGQANRDSLHERLNDLLDHHLKG